jgi:hypothetical protein
MVNRNYEQSLEQARRELANAVQERDRWNLEILRLQSLVKALAATSAKDEKIEQMNAEWQNYVELTPAIEALVKRSPTPISPLQVRDNLTAYGYDIGRYANPMAMIHQTLKRLAADRRIRALSGGKYTRTALYDALLNVR